MIAWMPEELEAARPPERITITEWSCKYRELGKLSAIKGLYNIDLVPFFRPALDRCNSPDVDEQSVCKPAQFGGTVAFVENIAGYYVDQDPSDVMVILADEDTAEYVATEKVAPMFKDSEHLSRLYRGPSFNKNEIRAPNGARVDFAWASSVAKLATRPKRVVIADEVNKPGYSMKSKEAGSMSLLRERTKAMPRGFFIHIFLSTPTLEGGNITLLAKTADVLLDWHCRCPYCGVLQPVRWSEKYCHGFKDYTYLDAEGKPRPFGRVVWKGGRKATREQIRDTARYECGTCKALWTTQDKNQAVRDGEEISRVPGMTGRKYWNHYNRILSLMDAGDLSTLVGEFVDCFKYPGEERVKMLQGFVNSALAEPFKQTIKTTSETVLSKAKVSLGPQTCPPLTVALTCFVDVQKLGFWFAVRAWARDFTSWLIHYGKLATWEDVENLLFNTSYPIEGKGFDAYIWRAGVDTGGTGKFESMSMTEETYFWIRRNGIGRGCRVWGTKGSPRPLPGILNVGRPLDKTPTGKPLPGGLQLVHLNTDMLKEAYHYRIQQAIEGADMAAYLHGGVDSEYFRQVTAEELQLNDKGVQEWIKIREDNHLLDCECGNIALASPEWPGGGVNLLQLPQPPKNAAPALKSPRAKAGNGYRRPNFLNRR